MYIFFPVMVLVEGYPTIPEDMQAPHNFTIEPIAEQNYDQVIQFDQSVASVNRSSEIKVFVKSMHTVATYCAINGEGTVLGYIIMREGLDCVRSSAFYAVSRKVAEALFSTFVCNALDPNTKVQIAFSKANIESMSMYEKFGFKNFFETDAGMYTKMDMPIKWNQVYAVLEFSSIIV